MSDELTYYAKIEQNVVDDIKELTIEEMEAELGTYKKGGR